MRFFISCHHKQGDIAYDLIKALSDLGHQAIAINLRRHIGKDIFNAKKLIQVTGGFDYVLVILSTDYLNDEWLQKELHAIRSYEVNISEGDVIVPILYEECEIPDFINSSSKVFLKLYKDTLQGIITKLIDYLTKKRQVFVVMKMSDDSSLELAYRDGIIQAITQSGYINRRIDDYKDGDKISPRILKEIRKSDIIIADLTGERPNCYYEVGYAHAIGKKVILSAKERTNVHFDLKDHNFIFWKNASDLKDKLLQALDFVGALK